jgi:thiopeptide-type bacteriocin biosynthesis protein
VTEAAVDTWVSVHAFHHGDLDALLAEAVAPVVRDRPAFFLRYWEGGPHIRLRVAEPVRAELHAALSGWLAAHRHPSSVTPEQYALMAESMAAAEGMTDFERELRAADTVADVPYRPEHDVFGAGDSLAAVERHFVESSALALDIVAERVAPGRRRGFALSAGLLSLAVMFPDLPALAAAFAGGTAAQLADGDDGIGYPAQRDRLRGQALRAWELAGTSRADDTATGRWLASVRALHNSLRECALTATEAASPMSWQLDHLPPESRPVAAIMMRCTHLLCNRLGVGLTDEMYVNTLIARVLVDLGTDPQEHTP